jgi:hypothetical protein
MIEGPLARIPKDPGAVISRAGICEGGALEAGVYTLNSRINEDIRAHSPWLIHPQRIPPQGIVRTCDRCLRDWILHWRAATSIHGDLAPIWA